MHHASSFFVCGIPRQDDDGNLDLAEFTHIVHEVDNGHACANAGLRSTYVAPDERDVREIAGMYTYAVEADEDDDDMISPVRL